ncbi:hypothetical protein A6P54_17785 [Bacillus sp. MKU004]|nr:hypothetical protein A6P54_17785 [Bacillus sp. MKU004]
MVNNKNKIFAELVGEHLKRRRLELGMTQAEFAETIGLSEKGVGRIERGERSPTCRTLSKILKESKISIDQLLQDVLMDMPSED